MLLMFERVCSVKLWVFFVANFLVFLPSCFCFLSRFVLSSLCVPYCHRDLTVFLQNRDQKYFHNVRISIEFMYFHVNKKIYYATAGQHILMLLLSFES